MHRASVALDEVVRGRGGLVFVVATLAHAITQASLMSPGKLIIG
jgi:hypothetical protein